jgi:chemotaxis protein MotB
MHRAAVLSIAGGCLLAATGCVQQQNYDSLLSANRSLKEQNVRLTEERDSARASLQSTQSELNQARQQIGGLQTKNSDLSGDVQRIAGNYDELMSRVATLDVGPLPPHIAMALENLAEAHPGLLTFDSRRGMIQLASDLTFAPGSTDLQTDAIATIGTLADILNSGEATGLEVRVVGHTDNVPIGKPDTRQRHPTNVHLSVHRAISVRDTLVQGGIEPTRVLVAGYGEHRPVVPNGRNGAAQNRRVEIFLASMSTGGTSPVTSVPADAQPVAPPDPMK